MPFFGGIPPECAVLPLREFESPLHGDRVWIDVVPRCGGPEVTLGLTDALLMLRLTLGTSPPSSWVADPGAITS
jgi:hypothetical protein